MVNERGDEEENVLLWTRNRESCVIEWNILKSEEKKMHVDTSCVVWREGGGIRRI